jgi:hypothetical protein
MLRSFNIASVKDVDFYFYRWKYSIIDDDFVEEDTIVRQAHSTVVMLEVVVAAYLERDLPVAPNLFRAMVSYEKQYNCNITDYSGFYSYNPTYKPYENSIQRLFLLK